MKSLISNVFFPAWVWINDPTKKFLFISYAERLAIRDSMKCRKLIESKWYQERFDLSLTKDNNQKSQYDNTKGGYRYSFGFNSVTGNGGDFVVVDDPLDAEKANSELELNNTNYTYDSAIYNRLNDPNTGVRIIIMQRLHENDLCGHILENRAERWENVVLPAEYDGIKFVSSITHNDIRTVIGELLWPDKFNQDNINDLKQTLGTRGYESQYLQRPSPKGGFIYKEKWFERKDIDDSSAVAIFHSWDTASSVSDDAAYSSGVVGYLTKDYRLFIREVYRERLEFPQLANKVEEIGFRYNQSKKLHAIIIEEKSSGIALIQTIAQTSKSTIRKYIKKFKPNADKITRASQAAVWCENGSVILPPVSEDKFEWLFVFEDELFKFPNSKYKDQSDSFAQLIIYLEPFLAKGLQLRQERFNKLNKARLPEY